MNMAVLISMIAALCVNHSGFQTNGEIEKCEAAMLTCTTKTNGKTTTVKSDTEVFACTKKLVQK
jgi:hypothetical protein